MNAGELVISLLLKAGAFKKDLSDAQNSLDQTGEAGRQAMDSIAAAASNMSVDVVNGSQNAASGLGSLADKADDVSEELEQVSKDAQKAGKELQDAAKKGDLGFKSLLPTLTKVAGFVGVGLSMKGLVSTYLDQADAIGKYSDALNLNVEDVQAWEEAVKHAGGNGEEFKATLNGLTQRLTEAATMGTGEMVTSLQKLGISAKDASGKTKGALDFLPELAKKFEKMSAADAAGFGQKLGIDKGTIMLLQQGRKATEAAIKAGKEHIKFTKADADAAAKANDAMQDMQTAFMSLAMRAVAPFIPLITKVANILHDFAQWCSQNQEAVVAFFVAIATVVVGKAIPAMIQFGKVNAKAMLPLMKLMAVIAALGFAFDELWAFVTGGDSILERFMVNIGVSRKTIESLRETLKKVIGFVLDLWDALTGDPETAQAAWARVKQTWEDAKAYLAGLIDSILATFSGMIDSLRNWFGNMLGSIKDGLLNLLPDWVKRLIGGGEGAEGKKTHDETANGNPEAAKNFELLAMANGVPLAGMMAKDSAARNVDNSKHVEQTNNINQTINASPGMDTQALADSVNQEVLNQTAQIDGALR